MLSSSFSNYFKTDELSNPADWIQQPFLINIENYDDDKLDLIDLQSCRKSQLEFENLKLENFWCSQLLTFPRLAKKALTILIPFIRTYLCEKGFSTLLHIKTQERNRLDPSDDMRVALSKKEPRFEKIVRNKQQQKKSLSFQFTAALRCGCFVLMQYSLLLLVSLIVTLRKMIEKWCVFVIFSR